MISRFSLKSNLLQLGALCALLSPALGNGQSQCVHLISDGGAKRTVPVALGSVLRLSFRHSIYASQVEEIFVLRRGGFELSQLRYSEARLVEFYGHETSRHAGGVWIVTPKPTLLPSLKLNLSNDAAMSLRFDHPDSARRFDIHPKSTLHLTITSCESDGNG